MTLHSMSRAHRIASMCVVALLAANGAVLATGLADAVESVVAQELPARTIAVITMPDGSQIAVDPTTPAGYEAIAEAKKKGGTVTTVAVPADAAATGAGGSSIPGINTTDLQRLLTGKVDQIVTTVRTIVDSAGKTVVSIVEGTKTTVSSVVAGPKTSIDARVEDTKTTIEDTQTSIDELIDDTQTTVEDIVEDTNTTIATILEDPTSATTLVTTPPTTTETVPVTVSVPPEVPVVGGTSTPTTVAVPVVTTVPLPGLPGLP